MISWTDARILILDDQEYNVSLLKRMLTRAGFVSLYGETDPVRLKPLLEDIKPDIVLLDLHMPGMDGVEALETIRRGEGGEEVPVLMLTADTTAEAKQRALQAGANDFLTKPFDRMEVVLRINNLLRTRQLHLQLKLHMDQLEEKVAARTEELQRAKLEMLQLLGRAGEYRDDMTGQHTQRVGQLSWRIALELGCSAEHADQIRKAAPLHDIGKIGIPDDVLLKPGRFTPEEFEQMKAHTIIGGRILEGSSFGTLRLARVIAQSHHEKWDGTGYPQGLKGEEIPPEARIVALADFYDALTHERPYKRAWTPEEAIAEVLAQSGRHFDPQVVEAFLRLFQSGAIAILDAAAASNG